MHELEMSILRVGKFSSDKKKSEKVKFPKKLFFYCGKRMTYDERQIKARR
jgi:hypothetical protein